MQMLRVLATDGCPITGDAYIHAACKGNCQIISWLHEQGIPLPTQPVSYRSPSAACLLLLGDIGLALEQHLQVKLLMARKTFCTFHGMLRWCRRAISNPNSGLQHAFDFMSSESTRQNLLVQLALLPAEIARKIAVMADLQHDESLHPANP